MNVIPEVDYNFLNRFNGVRVIQDDEVVVVRLDGEDGPDFLFSCAIPITDRSRISQRVIDEIAQAGAVEKYFVVQK